MLNVTIFEFFFRAIPEDILLILAIHLFSFKKLNLKKILFSSISLSIIACSIRLLPILPGVHTLLLIPICVLFTNGINKIPLVSSVSATILSIIILFACEMVNAYILIYILHLNLDVVFESAILKTFYGIISLTLFSLICLVTYFAIYKNKIIVSSSESIK